jgi:hypothetical protein
VGGVSCAHAWRVAAVGAVDGPAAAQRAGWPATRLPELRRARLLPDRTLLRHLLDERVLLQPIWLLAQGPYRCLPFSSSRSRRVTDDVSASDSVRDARCDAAPRVQRWKVFEQQDVMLRSGVLSLALSLALACATLIAVTGNLALAGLASGCITSVVVVFLGAMQLLGWTLGAPQTCSRRWTIGR